MLSVLIRIASSPASVAQLDARLTGDAGSIPPGRQHSFVQI